MKIDSGRKLLFAILGLIAGFFIWELVEWLPTLFA